MYLHTSSPFGKVTLQKYDLEMKLFRIVIRKFPSSKFGSKEVQHNYKSQLHEEIRKWLNCELYTSGKKVEKVEKIIMAVQF